MSAFFVVLDNRSRFFNNNTRIIIFIRNFEAITLDIVIVVLERLMIEKIDILCFVL